MKPSIIAHRGLRNELPENTRESIAAALTLPALYGIEFDVELSRDNKPVILHQETVTPSGDLKRLELATRNYTSRDWVRETDSSVIRAMDAGSWMSPDFSSMRVPSLEEVLKLPWGSKVPCLELKDPTYWGLRDLDRPHQLVTAVQPYLESFSGKMNIISFNPEILSLVKTCVPSRSTTLALWTEWQARSLVGIQQALRCGATSVSLPDFMLLEDPSWVQHGHAHGLTVSAYPLSPSRDDANTNSNTLISRQLVEPRLASLGCDFILSDHARETCTQLNGD